MYYGLIDFAFLIGHKRDDGWVVTDELHFPNTMFTYPTYSEYQTYNFAPKLVSISAEYNQSLDLMWLQFIFDDGSQSPSSPNFGCIQH